MLESPTVRRVPILVWVFLALAAVDLAVHAAFNWYQLFGPYLVLRLEDIVRPLIAVGPFLLAAGVLAGASAWPAGQGRLRIGGILIGLYGLYGGGADLYFATLARDSVSPLGPVAQAAWIGLAVASSVALAAGSLLVADGLRVSGSAATSTSGLRGLAIVIVAALVVLATAATAGLLVRESALAPSTLPLAYSVAYRLLLLVAVAGIGLAGIFALRTAVTRVAVSLIAIGAALDVGGAAWFWGAYALLWDEIVSRETPLTAVVPQAIGAVGLLLVALGFGAAAIAAREESA